MVKTSAYPKGVRGAFVAALVCDGEPPGAQCEAVFESGLGGVDVLLLYADTYESPSRGTLTDAQWAGLFAFVESGGGLFALHTASACWDHQADAPNATSSWSFRFHHELLNCEFGGHSPYKDYISHVVDPADAITRGLGDYVVTDELYHPKVYDAARSTIFLTAFDQQASHEQSNASVAVHGLRHAHGDGRVLYFAQGHDMAEFETTEFEGNHAFQTIVKRSLLWLGKRA